MIVTQAEFPNILELLLKETRLALDSETTGLRMYHGDRLFSIIISTETQPYYFNFNMKDHFQLDGETIEIDMPPEQVLPMDAIPLMRPLFMNPDITWFIQNAANFDMGILAVDGIEIEGHIHCTKAIGRVEYNDHRDVKTDPTKKAAKAYSLEAQLFRLGHHKDDAVKAYVDEHKLKTQIPIPGKEDTYEKLHYDKVPFRIMVPYGLTDGKETFFLGDHQEKSICKQDLSQPNLPPERSLRRVMENEKRLQKTIFRMRHRGVLVDLPYCKKAAAYEKDRSEKAREAFRRDTGKDFSASPNLFKEIFASEKEIWGYTDKGNPSFDSDYLGRFKNPAAGYILTMRDAKSKADFYNGFLWFADSRGVVHPNFNPEGTVHGRFSSSEPNFQNLTSEESEEEIASEFIVRRALIPRPGMKFLSIDMTAFEYKFMLELACKLLGRLTELGQMVVDGFDFHEATAQNAAKVGSHVIRKQAKIANFLTLYGGGIQKLADALSIPYAEAAKIRKAIFQSSPEIKNLLMLVRLRQKSAVL